MRSVFRVSALLSVFLLLLTSMAVAAKAPKPSKKDQLVTISTSLGDIKLILFDATPQHKANFLKLAESGFYNGTTFHRIIPNFMVQGGDANSKDADPANDGMGQPNEQTIPAEIRPELKHRFGALAAARQGDFVNPQRASSASQFYLVQNHQGTSHLDGQYTVFGQVVSGLDIIDKIAAQPKDDRDRPLTDLKMTVKVEKLKKKRITELYGYAY
ncbi:peptidylprolyl isomerase [Microvirga sp. STR05]|uniref:Peptidyl-prolyl cis-trans isomerase n=1 Tax=Hymenobacter duratus TaxID=2771356 RepID=A0ABR8JFM0_9BACT|nr:peptidylprolyl isomerase [Hymenobacter duratus]MBD2714590.1 peptidylprolyl isomerase [Hymenobacter duratus]MBR7949494.1 peptidylprolyl isomerase [Microvirga sp. STR05]